MRKSHCAGLNFGLLTLSFVAAMSSSLQAGYYVVEAKADENRHRYPSAYERNRVDSRITVLPPTRVTANKAGVSYRGQDPFFVSSWASAEAAADLASGSMKAAASSSAASFGTKTIGGQTYQQAGTGSAYAMVEMSDTLHFTISGASEHKLTYVRMGVRLDYARSPYDATLTYSNTDSTYPCDYTVDYWATWSSNKKPQPHVNFVTNPTNTHGFFEFLDNRNHAGGWTQYGGTQFLGGTGSLADVASVNHVSYVGNGSPYNWFDIVLQGDSTDITLTTKLELSAAGYNIDALHTASTVILNLPAGVQCYSDSGGFATVPEPASMLVAASASALLLMRRRSGARAGQQC